MKTQISKTHSNAEIASLQLPTHAEHSITVQASEHNKISTMLQGVAKECNATILNQFVFGGTQHSDKYPDAVLLQGDACDDGSLYSTQVCALSGIDPEPVIYNDHNVGYIYEDSTYRICRLKGIVPQYIEASRIEQTSATFEMLNDILQQNGFKFTDTIRTWIYLDRLLEWYDDFNVVRTDFFEKTGVFDAMVPASTGIGAANKFGAAIMMDLIAVQPLVALSNGQDVHPTESDKQCRSGILPDQNAASDGQDVHPTESDKQCRSGILPDQNASAGQDVRPAAGVQLTNNISPKIVAVKSPLQNPALDYKSSFSRAVEIEYPTHRKLMISGTASIDDKGHSVHLDDPEKQIRLTMEVVHKILTSRDMDWGDLFRGIAYFKDMAYKPIYEKVAAELGIPHFPLAISHADVCRHDLLFEIEVDAVKLKS